MKSSHTLFLTNNAIFVSCSPRQRNSAERTASQFPICMTKSHAASVYIYTAHTQAHTQSHMCSHAHKMLAHAHVRTHAGNLHTAHIFTHVRAHTCVCTHKCMSTQVRVRTHVHTHTCTYTHNFPHCWKFYAPESGLENRKTSPVQPCTAKPAP